MPRIQIYIVQADRKTVKADLGLVDYPEIPLEKNPFTLGDGKRYVRRELHIQPPPMVLYIEQLADGENP